MEFKLIQYFIIGFLIFLLGCAADQDSNVDLLTAFDFESGVQQWEGGISDYPVTYEDSINFVLTTNQVASSFDIGRSVGLNVSGENPHGDLFYFFMRKVSGLEPGKKYNLDFEFFVYAQLLNKPESLSSEELYLKVGAVNFKPELEEVIWRNSLKYMALNIEKGEVNSDEGVDMINMGSIKHFTSDVPDFISGNTFDRRIEIEPDKNGDIWILIGVDSGIRSYLTFGMEALTVYYREKN